jgi:hypothetical protein
MEVYWITRRQNQYENDSLTKGMKQIIQYMGKWWFVIANFKVIIATIEYAKCWPLNRIG